MIRSTRTPASLHPILCLSLLLPAALLLGCSETMAPEFAPAREGVESLGPRGIPQEEIAIPSATGSETDLRAAIAAAADGDTVRVRAAHYLLTTQLVLNRSITLIGEPETVLELVEGTSTSVIAVLGQADGSPVTDVHIESLKIIGNGASQTAGAGVALIGAQDCSLRNMVITDCFEDGIYLSGVTGCLVENVVILRCGRNGLAFGEAILESSSGNTIVGCRAAGNGLIGFDGEPVRNTRFIDCISTDNALDGFMLGAEGRSSGNAIINCQALYNGNNGCSIWANDNRLEGTLLAYNAGTGVTVMGPVALDNVIAECDVNRNGWHGLLLDRTTRAQVLNCKISFNALTERGDGIAIVSPIDVYGNRIIGNTIRGRSHYRSISIIQRVWGTEVAENDVDGSVLLQ